VKARCCSLALVALAGLLAAAPAHAAFSDYGFAAATASTSTSQAGAHPDMTLAFELKTDPATPTDPTGLKEPYARTKDLTIELPPGLIGNPNAIPRCTTQQFVTFTLGGEGCPQDTQVGVTFLSIYGFFGRLTEPIFNMAPPSNDTVARLGFYAGTLPYFISIRVRSGSDYGLTATLEGLPASELVVGATTQIWGVPADDSHDTLRLTPREAFPEFKSESPPRPSGLTPAPFLSNPTRCGVPLGVTLSADSFQLPGQFATIGAGFPGTTGCGKLDFDPEFAATPSSREAAGPTGLDATLTIPQNETVNGLATSQLRGATVTLPEGMTIASGAADGLQACSAEQVRLGLDVAASCPQAAKIGTAEFDVPALSRRVHGALYQRTPEPGNLFRIWLVMDELGVHVKIPGQIDVDRRSGQITSVFVDTPQVPVRELKLHFKSGPRGVLANPAACGGYATRFAFAPWSGTAPVSGEAPMRIDERCATGGFSPALRAGTVSPSAGEFSPFVLEVTRGDGEQNIVGVELSLPPGLLAKLAGVPLCSSAAAASGSCPTASQVGRVSVATGPGTSPLWIPQPGKAPTAVYLAGPYKGEPYSLVVRVPAQAGPFDLGTVVTRVALAVDPVTTQVTAVSDPLPQILEGVPVTYRTVQVDVDRRSFTLNPTSCDPMRVRSRLAGAAGTLATPSSRFQAANCAGLGFKPPLSLRLRGGTKRGQYPQLRAVLRPRRGDANLARASVALPHSEFLAQEHIRTICTRVQFAADNCPKASIYGHARAVSPLLDQPLAGPVYLRSSSNPLPDLVVALRGSIDVDLAGRIDSIEGGIRTTFPSVPDAPVTKFVLNMKDGAKSLLVNSRNLCSGVDRATVKMDGQNGQTHDFRSPLRRRCGR
jgi:hypothetical protein